MRLEFCIRLGFQTFEFLRLYGLHRFALVRNFRNGLTSSQVLPIFLGGRSLLQESPPRQSFYATAVLLAFLAASAMKM